MRKPLAALGLAIGASLGVVPVAGSLAATTASPLHTGSSPNQTASDQNSTSSGSSNSRPANAVSGAQIVRTAFQYLGYPYTATGNSPSTGFSCIGFVSYVYRVNGIALPGDLGDAMAYAPQVPFSDLQPGDILYFQNTVWNGLSHAAIYIGGGKFVHAEWYGKGVRVSSFVNDPSDGDYWIGHYLGANRPWTGASVGSVMTPPTPPSRQGPSTTAPINGVPNTQVQTKVVGGTAAVVSVSSLNVRSGPSKKSSVQQVLPQGAQVTIIGHHGSWYKVQLPDGSIGWVVAYGVGQGTAPSSSTVTGANGVQPTVGTPTAPVRTGYPSRSQVKRVTAYSHVNGLRVHASPSLAAPVTDTVTRGEKLTVIARSNGWIEVRTPSGTVGWISSSYASVHQPSHSTTHPTTYTSYTHAPHIAVNGARARVTMNVRSGPSLNYAVVTVIPAGSSYQVLGWSNGWAHVQLSNGTTGWVSGTLIGHTTTGSAATHAYRSAGTSATRSTATHVTSSAGTSVLTAGVRVHSAPGLSAPVVTVAAAGTHVRVLGYHSGWVLVRLPNGTTGYVLGAYVR